MALRARSRQEASFLISTVDRSGPAKHINFLSWGGGVGGTETHLTGEAYGIHIYFTALKQTTSLQK